MAPPAASLGTANPFPGRVSSFCFSGFSLSRFSLSGFCWRIFSSWRPSSCKRFTDATGLSSVTHIGWNADFSNLTKRSKLAKSYGGTLMKKRKGRSHPRPISTKESMHLVLRSSLAKGAWSFRTPQNKRAIKGIIDRHSVKWGVKVYSMANVGNHLHLHVKISKRLGYLGFIRSIAGRIAQLVMANGVRDKNARKRFWDYRPFTRVVQGFRAVMSLKDYVRINQLEGAGLPRRDAVWMIKGAGFT